jgi:hypothetical protein
MLLTNFGAIPSQGGFAYPGWAHGLKITIPANKIDEALPNHPVPVYLHGHDILLSNGEIAPANFDFSLCKPDGSDIRFTDKNLNPLKFERVEHGTVFAHYNVLIPFVSDLQDTEFCMWYGNENAYNTSIEAWQDMTGKQITYNGNVKLVPNVAKFGKAGYFNGSSYITVPDSEDWNFGSGDFTIRFHLNLQSIAGSQMVLSQSQTGNTWYVEFRPTQNMIRFVASVGGSTIAHYDFAYSPALGILKHYKLTRNGSTIALTEEGVALTPTITTPIGVSSMPNSTGVLHIGTYGFDLTEKLNGYLDELEIAKGIARTDGVPTEPYTADQYTKLLLHFDSAPFTDETGKTVTTYGDVKPIKTAYADGARSAYFDGSGDYFQIPYSTDWDLGSSPLTIERKVMFSAVNTEQTLITYADASSLNYAPFVVKLNSNGTLQAIASSGTDTQIINMTTVATYQAGVQYDIALTRSESNVWTLWVNGASAITSTASGTIYIPPNPVIRLGCAGYTLNYYFNGYDLGARVTKRCRYTGAHTPPSKFEIDGDDVVFCTNFDTIYDQNYAMVQHMGDTLVDATGNGNNGTATGTTVVSTAYGKAREFNGTSDKISIADSASMEVGSNNFALVAGIIPDNVTAQSGIIAKGSSSLLRPYALDTYLSQYRFWGNQNSATDDPLLYPLGTAIIDILQVVSVSRISTLFKLFKDGTSLGSDTYSGALVDTSTPIYIGANYDGTSAFYDGKMTELRMSIGTRSDAWIKVESLGLLHQLLTISSA